MASPKRNLLEDDLRAQLNDARIVGGARAGDAAEVDGGEVSVRRTLELTGAARSGGELGVVEQIVELKAQLQLRFFTVERRDLMQGPIEVVDAGSMEEIPTGIAQGERSRGGEAGRIEVVVRKRIALVCNDTFPRIIDRDRSHSVRTVPAGIIFEGSITGGRGSGAIADSYRESRLEGGDATHLPAVRQDTGYAGMPTAGDVVGITDHKALPGVEFGITVVGSSVERIVPTDRRVAQILKTGGTVQGV